MKKLGFCPTMEVFVEKIRDHKEIQLVPFNSAAEVLYYLKNKEIDIGFIGRLAKKREINDQIQVKRLSNSYTLIGAFKTGIREDSVKTLDIATYLPEDKVKEFIPEAQNVRYFDNIEQALNSGSFAVLIDWNDFKDDYELVIPVRDNGLKTLKFRTPTLFYYKDSSEIIEDISKKLP
jgi:hypothetical protein